MRIVFVTCGPGGAEPLLRALLDEGLVACGNIIPGVRSLYRWKGALCDDHEEILLMETSDERVGQVMARVGALHDYEVPKILSWEPTGASPAYAGWVMEQVRGA